MKITGSERPTIHPWSQVIAWVYGIALVTLGVTVGLAEGFAAGVVYFLTLLVFGSMAVAPKHDPT